MSKLKSEQVSKFSIEGQFLSFDFEDGYKLKYLRLGTSEGECCIKLCEELWANFELRLTPGDWLQVLGEKKLDRGTDRLELKAQQVIPATSSHTETASVSVKEIPVKSKPSILVCQKSDCMKRGGKAICQALQAALNAYGLEGQVTIKGTGCMKNCKAGPNLIMPDKTRHSRIQAAQIPALMDKYLVAIAE